MIRVLFCALHVLVLSAAAAGAVYLLAGCAHLSQQDKLDLSEYEAQQGACIAATPQDKAAIDACRAKVKADWCKKWAERFDSGVCE